MTRPRSDPLAQANSLVRTDPLAHANSLARTDSPAHANSPALTDLLAHAHTLDGLSESARTWLAHALAAAAEPSGAGQLPPREGQSAEGAAPNRLPPREVQSAPGKFPPWERHFAEAARRCGPSHADAVRVLLLRAAGPDTAALTRTYSRGTAAERRAVLRALPHLVPGPDAVPLVEDALRTNDTTLIAAALGPYAARHLDAHAWRHAVLKCLFTEVPVDEVSALEQRATGDAELARILRDQAAERTAAGREVPADLHRVLALAETTRAPGSDEPSTGSPVPGEHPHPHGTEP